VPKMREPVSDIDTEAVDSLKVLDPNRPIREATLAYLYGDILGGCRLVVPLALAGGNGPFWGCWRGG
jgi:hypothetical protein